MPFIQHASDILGDTNKGMSGPEIVKAMAAYAVEYDIDIPYASYPLPTGTANKRTALFKNLKIQLLRKYNHLPGEDEASAINKTLVEKTGTG